MTRKPDGNCYRVAICGTPFSFYVSADSTVAAARIAEEVKEEGSTIGNIEYMGAMFR